MPATSCARRWPPSLGFIETLRGPAKDDGEAARRFLGIMQEQAARMARLVDDLLSLSRIELNEHSMPTGTARLDAVLAERRRQPGHAGRGRAA